MKYTFYKRVTNIFIGSLWAIQMILWVLLFHNQRVTFGYGMGDLVIFFVFFVCLFLITYMHYYLEYRYKYKAIVLLILSIIWITLLLLNLTVWRGFENDWDGNIFIN